MLNKRSGRKKGQMIKKIKRLEVKKGLLLSYFKFILLAKNK